MSLPFPLLGVINITPNPILVQIGPLSIGWYGVGYVIGLAVMLWVTQRELVRRGLNPNHLWNALLLVGALALIGGRMYHVIDQWGACGPGGACYSQDPLRAILPPYAGLGLYGGIAGAALGIFIYTRRKSIPLALALDAVIAGTFFAQGIARWGNFFNQELYGPPTNLPWGIAIDCAHRVAEWACPPLGTVAIDAGFHPLFFYESVLDIAGGLVVLYLSRRYLRRIQPGDLAAFWAIWYGLTRTFLETFRTGWNWTLGGIPTAQLVGVGLILLGVIWIVYNHPRGKEPYPYLPPWTAEREYELALASGAGGGGSGAIPGGADPASDEDADDYDDDDDSDEWEDDVADELDVSKNESTKDS